MAVRSRFSGSMTIPARWGSVRCAGSAKGWKSRQHWRSPCRICHRKLAARLDEAWAAIKTGLVRGLSVGFRPHEYTFLDGGGLHFLRWELMEVSAVTVPANAECTIRTIKSYDRQFSAAVRQPETGGENRIFCRRCGTVNNCFS
ncbi:putative major head protein/prohead protease [Escherichia coli]|uniref:Putative major head protein/prohead protease n=1 Tax=Escherichia coli TaxID=562 RepID=A0A376W3F7_ECOLX|nr:putative major head protein/prohead protease [Escherichia coli]